MIYSRRGYYIVRVQTPCHGGRLNIGARTTVCTRLRHARLLAGVAFCLALLPALSAQADPPPAPRSAALENLARQFSQKVGGALDKADTALSPERSKEAAKRRAFEGFEDGEVFLLSTTLREARAPIFSKYTIEEPITALKMGHDAYLSLVDFAYITGFAIKVDAETGIADGWYYQEDKPFLLDTNTHTITLGDKTESYPPDDVIVESGDIYVRSARVEDWFNLSTDISPHSQVMRMETREQLPLQARLQRQKRRNDPNARRRKPEKPRLEQEFKTFTLPRADIALTNQYEKRGDNSDPYNYSKYSAIVGNQFMDHEMTSYLAGTLASSYDSGRPLDQVRINFKKESENNDLLGPLQAKVYEFNDLVPTYVPNTGSASNERGVRISNQSSRYTSDTETLIDGDAQPGWDVELYRNNGYIGGVTVDQSGRYAFERVPLFAGDNIFRIVFFGPQGEQREEERLITVLPNLVGDIKGYYNASLTQKETITYNANPYETQDTGTMRFSGVYDRRVSDNLTLRGGLHTRETNGQRDNYFYSGAVTGLGDAIVNADLVTTSDGPFRAGMTARQRLGKHNATLGLDLRSADFSETYIDEKTSLPRTEGVHARFNGPFLDTIYDKVTYDAGYRISHDENGRLTTMTDLGLTSRYIGLNFDNELSIETDSTDQNGRDQVIIYEAGVRGNTYNYLWRGRMEYEIAPLAEPTLFSLSATRSFDQRLSGYADLGYKVQSELTTGTLGISYYGDKARISPQVSYDSDSNMQARVDVNFSLAKNPYGSDIIMSAMPMTSKGGLSVLAFLDKDGDGLFNGEDEPLQDVVIDSVQHSVQLVTDKDGKAFNSNMPVNRPTDVVMQESSAFDPSWVSGFDGVSVLFRPTEVIQLEFPILRGGEIDGTATAVRPDGDSMPARSVTLSLVTPDGSIAKTTGTPFDGFYVIEAIRPGIYYLTTDSSQSPVTAYRTPEKIIITPQGAQMYGKDLKLTRGYNIPFHFSAGNANPALNRRTKILRPDDIAREDVYIRLGDYRSALTASLAWHKLKLRTRGWNNRLTPVAADFDTIARDSKTGRLPLLLKPAQPLRLNEAALLCEKLVDAGFEGCGVDVVTTYHDGTNAAQTTTPDTPKG